MINASLIGSDVTVPVSVVIPCYQCSDTIRAAVESIVNQTARPIEIILVDDCSGDGGQTLALLWEIQRELDELIRVHVLVLSENRGAGEARNAGWAIASQHLVSFLDADDAWHPRKLEIQTAWMLAHPAYLLTCHDSVVCSRGVFPQLPSGNPSERAIVSRKLLFRNEISTRTVMLRRETIQRFPKGVRYAEDYQLWLRVVLSGGLAMRMCWPLACSYKEEFGAGGLTGDLGAMHKGVLHCFAKLRRDRLISSGACLLAVTVEVLKYWRRKIITAFRRRVSVKQN